MEWNRGASQTQTAGHTGASHKKKVSFFSLRVASVGLVVSIAILVMAVIGSVAIGGPTSQSKYVDADKIQAVFLNGSTTPYFGKITTVNNKFLRISDIYYLRVNQQVQPDGTTAADKDKPLVLVKLGCEVHGPQDGMVINQDQVLFWENLKSDGQVAKGIAEIKSKYDGDCAKIEAAANANSSSATGTTTTKKP